RRDHHQRPAPEALQGHLERLRRRDQGGVHQSGHHLHLHDQSLSVRQADPELAAGTRAGEVNSGQWSVVSEDRTMDRWAITNPWVFFGLGGALVAYLLYTMVRRRRGERKGVRDREPEL